MRATGALACEGSVTVGEVPRLSPQGDLPFVTIVAHLIMASLSVIWQKREVSLETGAQPHEIFDRDDA